ncbi:acetylcholinesterase [Plectosphaerella cucumerina]|uniref:Carboxylic ester hydrolase n=1 Tax=Plectosphaerella cucumerina TaxID=40658 RepID=A0A8K0TMJ2_9PEZI|nr:acetylcholinesterase [Plectosphaerella cucumerina]
MKTLTVCATLASQAVLGGAAPTCPHRPVSLEGYGDFSGTTVNATYGGQAISPPVDAWLGIDYTTQPAGEGRRFTAPDWPAPFEGIRAADTYGKACIQELSASLPASAQDEACLNFNVYRTPGVPLSQKLPVLVWIHGGAFFVGSYKSFDGAAFAAASTEPIVVISFHYRVSSLGFLPSELLDDRGLSNLGIRDQRFFLDFVQRHISAFGGDPDTVTIGGRSAGAHSVGIHYFHNYGEDAGKKPPFARAIHQSGSVTSRAFPDVTYPLYQRQYAEYTSALGCDGLDGDATLACLRAAPIDDVRTVGTDIFYAYNDAVTWPFQPVQGGPLFEKAGSQSGIDGTFHHVPTISSTTTDEGKYYMPGDLETNEEFLDYLHNISPALTADDLDRLAALYPDPAGGEGPFANSPNSTQYNRLSAAWSDYAYICPGQETVTRVAAAGVPAWKLRFNTNNFFPAWRGIPHTSDTRYTWADPGTQFPAVGNDYHAYLASFVTSGDPNTHRFPGSPEWPPYEPQGGDPGRQLVVQPGDTKVEDDDIRSDACLYWRDPERAVRLNK